MKVTTDVFWEGLNYDTVIVANGELPTHSVALRLLQNATTIVCCDGAVQKLGTLGIAPTVIVGDGDSIPAALAQQFADIFHHDTDQETNDLTKAVRYCGRRGLHRFAIVGAGGLREDHLLGNISLLVQYSQDNEVVMITNYGIFTPIHGTTTFRSYPCQSVSVFSFAPHARLTYHQLRYPVCARAFTQLWEGTLNVAEGNEFTIELLETGNALVYQAF